MHTASNIFKDSIDVLKADNENRCLRYSVKLDCISNRMHTGIYSDVIPHVTLPWVLSRAEYAAADLKMYRMIGVSSSERIVKVMERSRANNCHDVIYWGTTFARYEVNNIL